MSTQRNVLLVLDFDGTLTKQDTLEHVANLGYQRQARRSPPGSPTPWTEIVNSYVADYKHHTAQYQPQPSERKSIAEEVAWLNSLASIERASFDRAAGAGIFDDVKPHDLETYVASAVDQKQIQLRDGWAELFDYFGATLRIVSVNWSMAFISQVLKHSDPRSDTQVSQAIPMAGIYANEILTRTPVVGTATEMKDMAQFHEDGGRYRVHTSKDKLQILRLLRKDAAAEQPTMVYIGDSATDLECLLDADIGICMRDEPMSSGQSELAKTCERLGIEAVRIASDQSSRGADKDDMRSLLVARDFVEVLSWLKAKDV